MERWLSSMTIRSKKCGESVLSFVTDDIEHRRISGDVDAAVSGDRLFAEFRPTRLVGNMLFEGVERLSTQGDAVHEEENALHMSGAHEGVDQGDASAGLAGAGRHHEQEPAAIPFDAFHDRTDGLELEIAAGDCRVDQLLS